MAFADCTLERISDAHVVHDFTSGSAALDDWIRQYALRNDRMDSVRVFVLVEATEVVGYFALTMGAVSKSEAPASLVRGLPHAYDVGAVVLARFAIAQARQGRAYGRGLLGQAVRLAAGAGDAVAARLIVVDAIDDQAAAFYRRFGFRDLPENPLRLFVRLKDVVATIAESSR